MSFNVLELLQEEGYIIEGEDNVLHAEKAFFAARVVNWIKHQVQTNPDFDLPAYLTMLMYYKTDMADLKFSENEDKILYQMKVSDKEVQELVDSLTTSTSKTIPEKISGTTTGNGETHNDDAPPDSDS